MSKYHTGFRNFIKNKITLKKTVLILSSVSLIIYSILFVMERLNNYKILPFGFNYSVAKMNKIEKGRLNTLTYKEFRNKMFSKTANAETIKSITFYTKIYSPYNKGFRFYLSEGQNAKILCNNKSVKIRDNKFYSGIFLKKGLNRIKIKYSIKEGLPKEFKFFIKAGYFSNQLPFYYYILPKSIISRLLSFILVLLNNIKSIGFFLSFFIIFISIGKAISVKKKSNEIRKKKKHLHFYFMNFFVWLFLFSLVEYF